MPHLPTNNPIFTAVYEPNHPYQRPDQELQG
jgi:hypothetical protein